MNKDDYQFAPTCLENRINPPFFDLNNIVASQFGISCEDCQAGESIPDECRNGCLYKEYNAIPWRHCRFFSVEEISCDDDFPRREVMENIISAIANENFNFIYVLSGSKSKIRLYMGIVEGYRGNQGKLKPYDFASVLHNAFLGNFPSSRLVELKEDEFRTEILLPLAKLKRCSFITGVPTLNKETDKGTVITGVDRLISGMMGESWQIVVVCEPVGSAAQKQLRQTINSAYEQLHAVAKQGVQKNHTSGTSETQSSARGKTTGTNQSTGTSNSQGDESSSRGRNSSKGTNQSTSETNTTQTGTNASDGLTVSVDYVNKNAQDLLTYFDEILSPRLDLGRAKGLFRTSMYVLAENRLGQERLARLATSIFQGDEPSFTPLRAQEFPDTLNSDELTKMLSHFQGVIADLDANTGCPELFGHESRNGKVGLSTLLTAREVSVLAGLPTREVPGIAVRQAIDFGLNPQGGEKKSGVALGTILQRACALNENKIFIQSDDLNRHVFVTGVTGSGKTTTCQRLLMETSLPFLVIEPAKTEYRAMLGKVDGLQIFTLGNDQLAPFRFNPFELLKSETITSHIDMLKATFCAAFPMEAAMPFLLEEAIYAVYERFGWSIGGWTDSTKANRYCVDPWSHPEGWRYWPKLSDLLVALQTVVKNSNFDERLQKDYIASLVSRLKNLTVGSKGQMLDCRLSIDFDELLDNKVVFEMEDLRDPRDKSLMMGLILARLRESVKARYEKDSSFRYLVLIEEAHRLLSRTNPSEGESKRQAVEMFCDMLAEVRKYGLGLLVADQIPEKLAPDVLKNTNTKIVHKLLAKDDRDAIGDTMGMSDEQKEFLMRLRTGEAIVFSGEWDKPVHVKIDQSTDTTAEQREMDTLAVQRQLIKNASDKYLEENQLLYLPSLRELQCHPNFTQKQVRDYEEVTRCIYDDLKKNVVEELSKKGKENKDLNRQEAKSKLIESLRLRVQDYAAKIFGKNIPQWFYTSCANDIAINISSPSYYQIIEEKNDYRNKYMKLLSEYINIANDLEVTLKNDSEMDSLSNL